MGNSRRLKRQKKKQEQRIQSLKSANSDLEEDDSEEEDVLFDPKSQAQKLNAAGWDEEALGFTMQDLERTMVVLNSLGRNITAFKGLPFKKLRGSLHPLIEEQMKNYDVRRGVKRKRNELQSLKEQDKEWINKSALRAKRLAALEELNKAEATGTTLLLTHMGEVDEAVEKLRVTRVLDGVAQISTQEEEVLQTHKQRLNVPVNCYTCKRPFVDLHFFYDQLCPSCAALNYAKRNETVDLSGRIAIVTGARVKIGYRAALKLLRCGCTVIATSRFATDCAKRYSQESDFSEWKSRLHVYGIDFRDLAALEKFCAWLKAKYSRLDILINNACQTIRRPAQYYSHLMADERRSLTDLAPEMQQLLQDNHAFLCEQDSTYRLTASTAEPDLPRAFVQQLDLPEDTTDIALDSSHDQACSKDRTCERASVDSVDAHRMAEPSGGGQRAKDDAGAQGHQLSAASGELADGCSGGRGVPRSAAEMSQLVVLEEDAAVRPDLFPQRADGGGALVDVNDQQVDLRKTNSWVLKLQEVSTGELVEVMAINAIAPAVLNARLKGLLEASPEEFTFIVNVSAMEGKFYRWKSDQHPHTNMAKASLNMMTRTSAQDYVKSGIYMTAVDTGWINDEKPMHLAARHGAETGFQTPLDEIDAAARVLDPIIGPLAARARAAAAAAAGGEAPPVDPPPWGVFLKDFVQCEW